MADVDLAGTLLECNFLYDCIEKMDMQMAALRPIVKKQIGSGKYDLLQRLEHDREILKGIYDENRLFILQEYEKERGIEFELLKTPK